MYLKTNRSKRKFKVISIICSKLVILLLKFTKKNQLSILEIIYGRYREKCGEKYDLIQNIKHLIS